MPTSVSRALRTLLALSPVALAASSVLAQSNANTAPNKLNEVVITATRSPMRLGDVLGDLTVINRADIERQAFGNLVDLLRNSGCVEITRNGGPAANASVYLRGADSRHTVVLVDGVRVDSQSTGGASWQNLPLAQIERVEVLKGPASALYGSDAIGGVVQIITRKGSGKPQLDMGLGLGNLGQVKLDAGVYGGDKQFDYGFSLAGERGTGFNGMVNTASTSYNADKDGWRNYSAQLRLGGQLTAGHRLEFMGLKSRGDSGYDAYKSALDDRAITETQAARLSWDAQWLPQLNTQLSLGESQENYETKPSSPYLTETRIRTAALQGFYKVNAEQQINFLLERREDRLVNSSVTNGRDERSQNALGLSYLLSLGQFSLQAHGRHDDDSQFGGVNTGTLAAGYKLGAGWRLTASAGNAFRAPTLYQRGSIYGPSAGFAALQPERGHNKELGLIWQQGAYDLGITTYRNKVKDLIIFGAAGSCASTFGCYQNVSQANLQGTSLKAGAQLGPVRLSGNIEFSDPEDANTGKTLQRRAKRYGSLRAETELERWNLGATLQASGQRWDNAANTTRLGGYGLLNLDAQYQIDKAWRVQLNLDNVFNRSYQTALNYAQAPRTWLISLRYSPSL